MDDVTDPDQFPDQLTETAPYKDTHLRFGAGLGSISAALVFRFGMTTQEALVLQAAACLIAAVDHPEWAAAWYTTFDPEGTIRKVVAPMLPRALPISSSMFEQEEEQA